MISNHSNKSLNNNLKQNISSDSNISSSSHNAPRNNTMLKELQESEKQLQELQESAEQLKQFEKLKDKEQLKVIFNDLKDLSLYKAANIEEEINKFIQLDQQEQLGKLINIQQELQKITNHTNMIKITSILEKSNILFQSRIKFTKNEKELSISVQSKQDYVTDNEIDHEASAQEYITLDDSLQNTIDQLFGQIIFDKAKRSNPNFEKQVDLTDFEFHDTKFNLKINYNSNGKKFNWWARNRIFKMRTEQLAIMFHVIKIKEEYYYLEDVNSWFPICIQDDELYIGEMSDKNKEYKYTMLNDKEEIAIIEFNKKEGQWQQCQETCKIDDDDPLITKQSQQEKIKLNNQIKNLQQQQKTIYKILIMMSIIILLLIYIIYINYYKQPKDIIKKVEENDIDNNVDDNNNVDNNIS